MLDEEFKAMVGSLVEAKRDLGHAWAILDGTDGPAPGSEQALTAALAAIDALFAIESTTELRLDVAAPVEVQEFWDEHGQLPGFALGS